MSYILNKTSFEKDAKLMIYYNSKIRIDQG